MYTYFNTMFILCPQRFRTEFSEGKITGRVGAEIYHRKLFI